MSTAIHDTQEPIALARPGIQTGSRAYFLAIAAVTVLAAIVRAVRLDHPMRYDEAFNFLVFVLPGFRSVFEYGAPNNHVLNTLAEWLSATFGGISPAAIRMPAFLAGVALVPVTARLAVLLSGRRLAGVIAAALVGASGILIEYSANARGYSLVALAAVGMGICTLEIFRDARRRLPWAMWALVAAMGMLAVPVMLYPIAIFAVTLLLQLAISKPRSREQAFAIKRLAVTLMAAGGLTLLLYLPVMYVSGSAAVVANEFVTPQPLDDVLDGLPAAAATTLTHWTRDGGPVGIALVCCGLGGSLAGAWRHRNVVAALPLTAPLLLAAAAIAHRVIPFPRVWLFLLPLLLGCAAAGLMWTVEALSLRRARRLTPALAGALLAVAVGYSTAATLQRPYLISEEPATLVDAEAICRDVQPLAEGQTALVCWAPGWPSLAYYSIFHQGNWVAPKSDECQKTLIVVSPGQSPAEVMEKTRVPTDRYSEPTVWQEYPRATVYLAERRSIP